MKAKILPPCSYQGGKQRVSKEIVDFIFDTVIIKNDTKFFDLCCGSGVITLELISMGIKPENITKGIKIVDIADWLLGK